MVGDNLEKGELSYIVDLFKCISKKNNEKCLVSTSMYYDSSINVVHYDGVVQSVTLDSRVLWGDLIAYEVNVKTSAYNEPSSEIIIFDCSSGSCQYTNVFASLEVYNHTQSIESIFISIFNARKHGSAVSLTELSSLDKVLLKKRSDK